MRSEPLQQGHAVGCAPHRSVRPRTSCVALRALILVAVLANTGAAVAEELAPFPSLDAPPVAAGETIEEIIVRARSLERLQLEVFRAEQAFFDAYNAANTNHEFDIGCEFEAPTGSHIRLRVCRAAFVTKLEAQAAQALKNGLDPSAFYAQMKAKEPSLRAEIRNVATQNPEVLAALMQVGNARQAFDSEKARRCDGKILFCRRH